jgi:hypothetical protein
MNDIPGINELFNVAPYLAVTLTAFYLIWQLIDKVITKTFEHSRVQSILVAETVSRELVQAIAEIFKKSLDLHDQKEGRRHEEFKELSRQIIEKIDKDK